MSDIFKLRPEDYKPHMDPISDYIEQAAIYITKKKDIPFPESKKLVKKKLQEFKEQGKIKNPRVKFRERTLDGKILNNQITTLIGYINYVKQQGDIIVPSFTVYFNPKKKKSLHAEFISDNIALRSKHKKLAFKYKMDGDIEKHNYHNTLQKSMKIKNNSLSGAYASAGTVLYNPSAHYTLTSITRCVAGIGNAISESMISGNRHYRNPEVTLNHLTAILASVDVDKIEEIIRKYRLTIPTPDYVMENVIKKNTRPYWKHTEKEREIYKFLKSLSGFELAAIAYVNDLFQLRELNPEFMKGWLDDIIKYKPIKVDNPRDYLKSIPSWITNLLLHVESDLMRGRKYVLDGEDALDDDTVEILASTANRLMQSFQEKEDLIKTFFVTKVFPISIAYIKDMLREVIVLSDTDSTCATYQNWVEWYNDGQMVFNKDAVSITAAIMTFTTQAIDHYIKLLGANMNLDYDAAKNLEMKNEFFWDVFVNTDVSKHYYANVRIQEGNVFKEPDLEKKGVHLIASFAYGPVRKLADEMMMEIMSEVGSNKKISLRKYVKKVADMEKHIITKIQEGSPEVLKLEKIKEANAYKEPDISKTPYLQYLLWEEVFAPKYGHAPEPTYMALKIPTTINNKTDMKNFLDSIKDNELKQRFEEFLKKYNKSEIKTFKFPLVNLYNKGFPEEIMSVIDIDKVVKDNCNVLYMILNSLGYYIKPGLKVIDLIDNGVEEKK